jgi:hypothetical protein
VLVLEQGQVEQVGGFWEKKRLILDGRMGATLGKCRDRCKSYLQWKRSEKATDQWLPKLDYIHMISNLLSFDSTMSKPIC